MKQMKITYESPAAETLRPLALEGVLCTSDGMTAPDLYPSDDWGNLF